MKQVLLLAVLVLTACRPSADRAAAERSTGEQRADVTDLGGAGTPSRRNADPVAKGAKKAVVPPNAVIRPIDTSGANAIDDASAVDDNGMADAASNLPLNNLE